MNGDAVNGGTRSTAAGGERARGALLGLAVGDALGAPAENLRPSEIRRRWGRIEGFVDDDPAGTDDTEYAIFSGLLLARHGSALAGLLAGRPDALPERWTAPLKNRLSTSVPGFDRTGFDTLAALTHQEALRP